MAMPLFSDRRSMCFFLLEGFLHRLPSRKPYGSPEPVSFIMSVSNYVDGRIRVVEIEAVLTFCFFLLDGYRGFARSHTESPRRLMAF
jgi:hypothetical protein